MVLIPSFSRFIDEWAADNNKDDAVDPPHRFTETLVDEAPLLVMNLENEGIKTIVWATGYVADYSWLNIPVLDRKGKIKHEGGVVNVPGMYLIGATLLRRRKSTFIHGAEDDARDITNHLVSYLKVC